MKTSEVLPKPTLKEQSGKSHWDRCFFSFVGGHHLVEKVQDHRAEYSSWNASSRTEINSALFPAAQPWASNLT